MELEYRIVVAASAARGDGLPLEAQGVTMNGAPVAAPPVSSG